MLIGGIVLGLALGLLFGGRLERLAEIRLKYLPLLLIAVIVRFGTEALLGLGVGIVDTLRVPLLGAAYGLLLYTLWHNRGYPGLALAFVGIASNALVITVNGGRMPVWMPAYNASGIQGPLTSVLHVSIGTDAEFLFRLGPLGDIIPIPIPGLNNVASVGDLFLTAGLGFFLFATLLRTPTETRQAIEEAKTGRYLGLSGARTGLTASLDDAAALERPRMLGAGGVGMASPALARLPLTLEEEMAAAVALGGIGAELSVPLAGAIPASAIPRPRPAFLPRIRNHPYVRLSLNGSFSALWVGQVISLFGDRVNQLALIAFVFEITDSPLAVALTFIVSTIPNLLFSPIAGTFVDRWDQKQVLVVSDILRASLVLLVPVAVLLNVWLAYPLVFLITTVSIFFRPARAAVLPRIVAEEDLLAANSAMWVGETIADVVNYPIAGLFVVFLASSLPIAFWLDAVTYLASALLLATIVVPPLVRRADRDEAGSAAGSAEEPSARTSVRADLRTGWAFLRHETVLLANTLQGTVGQFAVGVVTVSSIVLARQLTATPGDEYRATYAFMETAIGLGNLIGGFVLGLLASRVRKGPLIIASYTAFGVLVFLIGTVPSVLLVLGLLFGVGVTNMGFIIPSQTLFQERTPPELMGRVVSFRFAMVFGGMSVAMAVGGLFAGELGPGPVIAAAGLISVAAGLSGLLVRELRQA